MATEDSGSAPNENNETKQSSDQPEEEKQLEEWEVQRNHHKSLADAAFQTKKDYKLAITHYTHALTFDPSNHILYSNRSASHLANNEISKALQDARKCIELNKTFVKGHNRLGSSLLALNRWKEAHDSFQHVLTKLDDKNAMAKKGVEDCMRVKEQREQREKEEEEKKKAEEELLKRQMEEEEEQKRQNEEEEAQDKDETAKNDEEEDEDDLLNDFFDEVDEAPTKKDKSKPDENESSSSTNDETAVKENQIQIQLSDLGNSQTQINRLLCPSHEWFNLNPFRVLDISHLASPELLSRRYKAICLMLHPDKIRNNSELLASDEKILEKAEMAFEYVRKAMNSLQDEVKGRHTRDLVEQGYKQGKIDYEAATTTTTENEEELRKYQEKATAKIFAEIEQKRRDVEKRKRSYEMRERAQEDAEVEKVKKERDFNKNWKNDTRVETRIGSWRNFQGGGDKKKSRKK